MVQLKLPVFLISLVLLSLSASSPAFAAEESASTSRLSLFNREEEVLLPDQAFKLEVIAQDKHTLQANFTVAPGHYLYRDRIKFKSNNAQIGEITFPKGDIKKDANFGETEVFHQSFTANIALNDTPKNLDKISVEANYQGCSEKGLCYAPIHKTIEVTLSNHATKSSAPKDASDDQVTTLLKGGKIWLIILGFFGFGLLLALTPCVLPMIPILSGIIVGDKKVHHHATSRLHAFNLSLAYVLGMSISYTLAGIAAGLSGQLLSSALQSAWVLGATAIVFVFLSFSMFGFYELRLPSAIENRMVNLANGIKGGQFIGVLTMGALSALIVSPCVAAPLAGALIYISQTHDVLLGGIALFSLSIGMGVPLLLIGASAGHVLPKAGAWMTTVRNFFGVMMLGMAIYIASPVIPQGIQMLLWAGLLIIPAMYLHAIDPLPVDSSPSSRLLKGVGIILLALGITLIIGAASGAKSPWQPLAGLTAPKTNKTNTGLSFVKIHSINELETQLQNAKGKRVMLDFYADWCVACKELEEFTFTDSAVKRALANVVLIQADVTNNSPEEIALLNRFKLFGPPGIIFFNKAGNEIAPLKVIGYQPPEDFIKVLNKLNSLGDDECNPIVAC
ncbi:MAG: protein-disulfide reductase DsbD [Methylophilaceae bacterium]|nr:MAG: protein-disulfide reductase DsbD [Methylophilaceae bacterium]